MLVRGIKFTLVVGDALPLELREECRVGWARKIIFVRDCAADAQLTTQVLSCIVAIRLGGSCPAPAATDQTHATAAVEFPIPQIISQGGGDSGARWHL